MPKIPNADGNVRRERLAVNLEDLDSLPESMRVGLLRGRLDLTKTVKVHLRKRPEPAVVFTCPLLEAAKACDIIRDGDEAVGDDKTRVYVFREGGWSRILVRTHLTVIRGGEVILNPEVFPEKKDRTGAEPVDARPMAPERML